MIFLRLRIVYHSVASLIPPWQGLLRFRERERRGPLSLSLPLSIHLSIYLSSLSNVRPTSTIRSTSGRRLSLLTQPSDRDGLVVNNASYLNCREVWTTTGPRYVASIRSQAFRVYVVAHGGVASNADSPFFPWIPFLFSNEQWPTGRRLARRGRIVRFIVSPVFFTRTRGFSYMRFNIHEFVGRLIDTSNGSLAPGVLLGETGRGDLHNLYLAIVDVATSVVSAVINNLI